MLSIEEIKNKAVEILSEYLRLSREAQEKLTDNTLFIADLGMDKVEVTEFLTFIEETFKIGLPLNTYQEIAQFKTIGDVVRYIELQQRINPEFGADPHPISMEEAITLAKDCLKTYFLALSQGASTSEALEKVVRARFLLSADKVMEEKSFKDFLSQNPDTLIVPLIVRIHMHENNYYRWPFCSSSSFLGEFLMEVQIIYDLMEQEYKNKRTPTKMNDAKTLSNAIENKSSDKNNICKFCNSSEENIRQTLYEVSICEKCHDTLKKYGSNNKDIDKSKYYYLESYLKEAALKRISKPIVFDLIAPYSRTERKIRKSNLLVRILAFMLPDSYKKLLGRQTQEIIEKELQESTKEINRFKQKREEENKKENESIAEVVARQQAAEKIYPERYRSIIKQAQKENILLYEYYLYRYSPDWEYRAGKVKERDNYTCQECGNKDELCAHHKITVPKGGDHFFDNLITLCKTCHLKKHPYLSGKIGDKNNEWGIPVE